jgi:NADH:ubiquinone oxidoreductase subunit 2 (subunit N)
MAFLSWTARAGLVLLLAVPAVLAASSSPVASGFSLANPLAAAAAYLALAISLFVLAQALHLGRQAKTAHREDLVLLLAQAAHLGVSPESPEFVRAQAALEARQTKAKKPKKERKAKAA